MNHRPRYYAYVALQIIVALILLALFLSLYKYDEKLLVNQCDEKAFRDMERIQLTIQREMKATENAMRTLSELEFADGRDIPQDSARIYQILERFLKAMPPSITGAIIGFEDGVLPQYEGEWGFIPLVRHVNDEYVRYQLGNERDIRIIHDWYRETKRLDTVRWAKAQLAEEGEVICGCCLPLHDREGRFVGVLEVDFSLDRLSAEVCNIRSYPHAEPLVIDQDQLMLMSAEHEVVLKETMRSLLEKRGLKMDEAILQNVKKGLTKRYHLRQGDFRHLHEVFFFHMHEPYTGWTIQMTCPADDVTAELVAFKGRMTVIAATIIALIILVDLTAMQSKRERRRKN